jgi:hypothetical protein
MKEKENPDTIIAVVVPEQPDPNQNKGGGNPMILLMDYMLHVNIKKKGTILHVDNSTRLRFIKEGIAEDYKNAKIK